MNEGAHQKKTDSPGPNPHLSDLHGAPVLICPARRPTERSAIKTSRSGGFPDWWMLKNRLEKVVDWVVHGDPSHVGNVI